MHIDQATRIFRLLLVLIILSLVIGCGEEGGDGDAAASEGGKSDTGSLVGTWRLSTINGDAPAEGVWLTWVFTNTRMTVTSEMDCVEVYTYSATASKVTATLTSRDGTECADEPGDIDEFPYELSGNTLTVDVSEDEDLETAVFVFTKA
ncbi:MAG TPA: lipocalin family protein [Deltaproteobacteria bacterium]|nr:lipocalin family protein [Deltaproteobacteria bacterium]